MTARRWLADLTNRVLVQLYKHFPAMADRWASRYRFVEGTGIPWASLDTPLCEARIALITTAGVHLKSQHPFNMDDPDGDPTVRAFPADVAPADLTITHKYYDHRAADADINVVLPIDRLRELRDEKIIGGIAPTLYSFMGHIDGPHLPTLVEQTAPDVADRLKRENADAVVLTPA